MSKQSIVYGSIKNNIVASDLVAERANRDFDHDNGEILCKTLNVRGHWEKKKAFNEFLQSDPILKNTHKFYEMNQEEMQEYQMKRLRRAFELKKDEWFINHDPSRLQWSYQLLGKMHGSLHQSMFCLCLQNLTSEKQA